MVKWNYAEFIGFNAGINLGARPVASVTIPNVEPPRFGRQTYTEIPPESGASRVEILIGWKRGKSDRGLAF